jgi:tetratricopeptide (TPR) repeat protein
VTADPYAVLALAEAGEIDSLRALGDDVESAVRTLVESDRAAALRLVGELTRYWQDTGAVEVGRSLTELALDGQARLAARDEAVAKAVPQALLAASELAFRQNDQDAARKRAHDTIRAAVLIEDYATASLAESSLARVAYRDMDAPRIEKHAQKALEYARDDIGARRFALHMLAWAAHKAGDMDLARRRFNESLEFRRKHGDRMSVAVELLNLADLDAEQGDLGAAARSFVEVMGTSREIDSTYMLVNTLPSIAALASRARLDEDAAALFGAGDAIAATAGFVSDPNPGAEAERDSVRTRLGEGAFAEFLASGTSLGNDEAVDRAVAVAARIALRDERGR